MPEEMDFEEKLSLGERLSHAYNAFRNKDPAYNYPNLLRDQYPTGAYPTHPGISVISEQMPRRFTTAGLDRTFATSIYERLATDCSIVSFQHVKVDENDRYTQQVDSGLNNCLRFEANIDQNARQFIQDVVLTFLDGQGVAAVVPVDTTYDPRGTGSYDIQSLRVGTVSQWEPRQVQVDLYNDWTGTREQLWLPKSTVALVVNPFRDVMNMPNSTLRRLMEKLALLDTIDAQTGAGKLDLIIQLPYTVKSPTRQDQAERRRKELEEQLNDSKYGVAYTDATEKIVQLNRPVENNIMSQVEYLTSMLYSQLGLTQEIMDGSANESTMLNYYSRTINVLLNAIADEFTRKFLTKTARTQGQRIKYFRDPFALTTSEQIAEIADKFTRNEIVAPNEMRSVVGLKPISDERADELRNRNLNPSDTQLLDPVVADREVGSTTEGEAP